MNVKIAAEGVCRRVILGALLTTVSSGAAFAGDSEEYFDPINISSPFWVAADEEEETPPEPEEIAPTVEKAEDESLSDLLNAERDSGPGVDGAEPEVALISEQESEPDFDSEPEFVPEDLDLEIEDLGEGGVSNLNRSIYGDVNDRLPVVENGRFILPALMAATTDQSGIGNGKLPTDFRDGTDEEVVALPESLFDRGLPASWTVRNWAAPNTFSLPRYFEDRMLERHGHERFPYLQPLASGVRFFSTIPMLPYLATVRPPCECEYTLGYYRTGSCAPVMLQRPPYERRAVIAEAAAIAGASIALP
ncbi:MAG: hypothetical protein AAF989_02755 [Planctomycetota bacterium]